MQVSVGSSEAWNNEGVIFMNDRTMREECESCKILVSLYGEDKLSICVRCGHYFYGAECDCRG